MRTKTFSLANSTRNLDEVKFQIIKYKKYTVFNYLFCEIRHSVVLCILGFSDGKCQELRIVGRIAHFINSFLTVNRCGCFVKQLPNGFPCRVTLSKNLATSSMQGSRYPARKTIRYSFSIIFMVSDILFRYTVYKRTARQKGIEPFTGKPISFLLYQDHVSQYILYMMYKST